MPRPYIGRFTSLSLFTRPAPDCKTRLLRLRRSSREQLYREGPQFGDSGCFDSLRLVFQTPGVCRQARRASSRSPWAPCSRSRWRSSLRSATCRAHGRLYSSGRAPHHHGGGRRRPDHRGSGDHTARRQHQTCRRESQSPPVPPTSAFSLELTATNGAHRPARRS